MSISNGFTAQEVRDHVLDYERQPYGTKTNWLREHEISVYRIRRWRAAVFDGDLDRGLVPREAALVDVPVSARRTLATAEAARRSAHDAEIAHLQQRVQQLQRSNQTLQLSNEALGKAIGLLQQLNEQEPDAASPPTPTTPPPASSFTPTPDSSTT